MNIVHAVQRSAAFLAATLLLAVPAWAKPQVTVSITAEKEITVIEKNKSVTKRVAAKEFTPGETILYTLSYQNSGTDTASNVVIDDPIPAGTVLVPGSASETGDLAFSIDHGKTYKKPTLLTYEFKTGDGKKEKRVASPEEYTNIRWTIPVIPAGTKGTVQFKVKVK